MRRKRHRMQTKFYAPDIECDGCATSINRALLGDPGVLEVQVDVPTKLVGIVYDESVVSERAIAVRLEEIGFPVMEVG